MDEATKRRVIAWEAENLDFDDTMKMMVELVKHDNLWVLKGAAGVLACVELMREELEHERS